MKPLSIISITIFLAFWIGFLISHQNDKHEALSNGAGYYDQKTGEFQFAPPPMIFKKPKV